MFLDKGLHTFDYYTLYPENNLSLQRILVDRTVVLLGIRASMSKLIGRYILYIDCVDHKGLAGMDLKAQCL